MEFLGSAGRMIQGKGDVFVEVDFSLQMNAFSNSNPWGRLRVRATR